MKNHSILIEDQQPEENIHCQQCNACMSIVGFHPLDLIRCPACETEQVVPATLGKYTLTHFLGEGAMGRVYKAKDEDLNRDVAIKLLRHDFSSTPKMWALLEKEAKAAANINHNNVVQIYSLGRVRGRPYIVMEMVQMGSLEDQMHPSGRIPEKEAVQIAIDVMNGLKKANEIELIHGDIKPANIILTEKGLAKLADFGLARFMSDKTVVERWGTPYYIAPEKAMEVQEDFRSDMYSLGVTLFHAVSGFPPYDGTNAEDVIQKALKRATPKLKERYPNCSSGFSEIVYKMMQRDPDNRFWSYDKAIACFQKLQNGSYRAGDATQRKTNSFWQTSKYTLSRFLRG
jgi:serine/threonine protein kinase